MGASSTRSALAARYASTVPWNSRCSLVTVVTTATSNRQLRVRPSASAWDVASITTLSLPASTMRASSSCSSSASGVVLRSSFGTISSKMPIWTVPIWPGCHRQPHSISAARATTVDLPSVPVTPMTVSFSLGRPNHASAASARAYRLFATTSCGTDASASSRSTTTAIAPFAIASEAKSCPSTWTPGTAKKSAPGVTARESYASDETSPTGMPTTRSGPTTSVSAPSPMLIGAILAASRARCPSRRAAGTGWDPRRGPTIRPSAPRDRRSPS